MKSGKEKKDERSAIQKSPPGPLKHEDGSALELAEPAVAYVQDTSNTLKLTAILGGAVKPENRMTSFEKIKLIDEGITKKGLENLKEKATLDYNQLAKVLSVARATLINKKGKEKFDRSVSERILSVADIYAYGYEVFEDEDRFNQWIFRANRSLNGLSPYDFLDSQYGREEIKNLIGRIEYGVYS